MKIEITVLNVKDGDAIIVYLYEGVRKLVVVIDAGHKTDSTIVIAKLNSILQKAGKKVPDLIVCTHYDADHIGGIAGVIQHYLNRGEKVGDVWLHTPGYALKNALEYARKLHAASSKEIEQKSFDDKRLVHENDDLLDSGTKQLLMESYDDMLKLASLLKESGIQRTEPFQGVTMLDEWPEVEILGPTREYYNKLFTNSAWRQILEEEARESEVTSKREIMNESADINWRNIDRPCEKLDNDQKDRVTSTNRASVILSIKANEKTFLFTGDAALESFEMVPDQKKLESIHWLKVPHHGSHNNISQALIKKFKTEHAFISGKNHFDPEVAGCLEKHGAKVRVTSIEKNDLNYSI